MWTCRHVWCVPPRLLLLSSGVAEAYKAQRARLVAEEASRLAAEKEVCNCQGAAGGTLASLASLASLGSGHTLTLN